MSFLLSKKLRFFFPLVDFLLNFVLKGGLNETAAVKKTIIHAFMVLKIDA